MSTTIRSTRYPSLLVAGLGVRFADGVLETDDPQVVEACRGLGRAGVVVDALPDPDADTGSTPDVPPVVLTTAPHAGASREAWAAWARAQEIDVPDGAKRDEIMELVAAHGTQAG